MRIKIRQKVVICCVMASAFVVTHGASAQSSEGDERCCGIDLRTIVGFEQSGATNASSNQTYFLDFFFSQPVPYRFGQNGNNGDDVLGPRFRWFGEVRITSSPQQIGSSLAQFVG